MESGSSGPSGASRGISLGGGGLGPSGQEPMGFQEGKRRYPFPACPWEDRDPVPCATHWGQGRCPEGCSSCAYSSARHFLGAGAWGQYLLAKAPAGGRGQAGRASYWKPDSSVSLPSCPLHSLASCFHAASRTGPSLARPEPGCPCLGHLSCYWVGRAKKER